MTDTAANEMRDTPPEPTGEARAGKKDRLRTLTRVAVVLGVGSVAIALLTSIASGQGLWHFSVGFTVLRYAFYAAVAGALLALVAIVMARRARRPALMLPNLVALVVALGFVLYLGNLVRIARSVPALHDVTTNLTDIPQFNALPVRADNMEKIPDENRPELKALPPEARWKALHQQHYGDLKPVRLAMSVPDVIRRAERLARERGWEIARVDTAAGLLEATETSRFFRFKDDVVVRARPAPDGGTLVDMRSISRVGGSDVGMNAKRVRAFLEDLAKA
jgi:uncharacterized protein (DUF1499 family)